MNLICVKCKNQCKLTIFSKEEELTVKGNKCSKGKKYALKKAENSGFKENKD